MNVSVISDEGVPLNSKLSFTYRFIGLPKVVVPSVISYLSLYLRSVWFLFILNAHIRNANTIKINNTIITKEPNIKVLFANVVLLPIFFCIDYLSKLLLFLQKSE